MPVPDKVYVAAEKQQQRLMAVYEVTIGASGTVWLSPQPPSRACTTAPPSGQASTRSCCAFASAASFC